MTIYIDDEYRCYTQNDGTMREVETDFFDGKCTELIEGYRFVPDGETWTREDGELFTGEMIAPWMDCSILETAQDAYEQAQEEFEQYLSRIEAALEAIDDDN